MLKNLRVLVADDSAYLRKNIADILKAHKSIKNIDFAKDGAEAVKFVKKYNPDVLVLDLVMPKMNGLDAFKLIMEENPTPTVILSAISPKNLDTSIQALLMGAIDYIIKPGGIGAKDLPRFREELLVKVLLASQSQIKKIFQKGEVSLSKRKTLRQGMVDDIFDFGQYLNRLTPIEEIEEKSKKALTDKKKPEATLKEKSAKKISEEIHVKEEIKPPKRKDDILNKKSTKTTSYSKTSKVKEPIKRHVSVLPKKRAYTYIKEAKTVYSPNLTPVTGIFLSSKIIVIGASVGGPRTISTILKEIPKSIRAPILIVQHLAAHFTEAFTENLNLECDLDIKIAMNGAFPQIGKVYIAPGGKHMEITERKGKPCLKTYSGTPVNFCMPSIDVLFFSAAKIYRSRVMGVLLTGMGADGVNGLGAIQKVGGKTIAESEETCVLFAMPKLAAEKGFADFVLANYKISDYINKFIKSP